MTDQPQQPSPEQPSQPPAVKFDPSASHQQKPRLRPVRGFPLQAQNQQGQQAVLLGLADARQISDKVVATLPAAQVILPMMDGSRTIDQIVTEVGRGLTRDFLEHLVAQLDDAALLFGPNFDALQEKVRADFDSSELLPPASTAAFADQLVTAAAGEGAEVSDEQKEREGPERLRETLDKYIAEALKEEDKPSLDTLPKAIVAPHIDYGRGWINYASIWGRLRVVDRPDRVIILGTNHFGQASGVCGCDKGYRTPLGACELDRQALDLILASLGQEQGERFLKDRYDHEQEHSIELQIPWIQHVFGQDDAGAFPKVLGVLVHDPAVNNGESYDGKGLAFEPFIEALRSALASLPGRTLVVSSADLSHVGPAFGDQQPLMGEGEGEQQAEQFRNQVIQTDRELLELYMDMKADDLIASMAWRQNPTRWCSTGNMVAALRTVDPERVELLKYGAAIDQQGMSMVSNAAMVLH